MVPRFDCRLVADRPGRRSDSASEPGTASLERSWQGGFGPAAWRQLSELEKQPITTWSKPLKIRFYMQRARMISIRHRDLTEQNLRAALELCQTDSQRCRILTLRARLERNLHVARQVFNEAVGLYHQHASPSRAVRPAGPRPGWPTARLPGSSWLS